MSNYIGVEPKVYPRVHCSPDVLVGSVTRSFRAGDVVTMIYSEREKQFVVHEPANDAIVKLRRQLLAKRAR